MNKKASHPDITLILPCFNEENIIRQNVSEIERILNLSRYSYEIIFVDDKSSDLTRTYIKNIVKKHPNYSYIFHEVNTGRGGAVRDGIVNAKGTVVGFIDIDLEVSPTNIPLFVSEVLDGQDVVIGWRIYKETLTSLHRHILSRGYLALATTLLNLPLHDTEQGYKFFRRKKILPVLDKTKNQGWFWDTEILARAYYQGLSIKEIPVLFVRNIHKQSSLHVIRDTMQYAVELLSFWKTVTHHTR